jgi:conjugal transfer ATP-binding protein TraC
MKLAVDEGSLTRALPYWGIQDGVVILADGTYELGVAAELPATETWDTGRVVALVGQVQLLLNHAVPEGERLRVVVEAHGADANGLRTYAAQCTSTHPIVQALHQARTQALSSQQQAGRLVTYRLRLGLTHRPAGTGRRRWQPVSRQTYEAHRREMRVRRDVLLANCARAGLVARPMEDRDLLEAVWRYFNPARKGYLAPPTVPALRQMAEIPPEVVREAPHLASPSVRTRAVRGDAVRRYDFLYLDERYVKVVAMEALPDEVTVPNLLLPLLVLPHHFWLVLDVINDPRGEAVKALEAKAKRAYAARWSNIVSDREDPRSRVVSDELEGIIQRLHASATRVFRVGAAMTLAEPTEDAARAAARHALDAFHQIPGVDAVVESGGLMTQFVSLAPFSGRSNVRLFKCLTENAADCWPAAGPWRGSETPVALFGNRWDGLTAVDPYDPRAPAWNAIVVGESGSGKTHFANQLLLQLLAGDPEVVIVDRGGGYRTLVELLGGQHIRFDAASDLAINPFDLPDGHAEPDPDKVTFLTALVAHMTSERGETFSKQARAVVESALWQTYRRQDGEAVCLHHLVRTLRTLEQVGEHAAAPADRALADGLATRLQGWTGASAFGRLLDRPTTIRLDRDLVYFDTEGLQAHPDLLPVTVLLITDLVWRRVQAHPSRRKLVVFDEVWTLLADQTAGPFIEELYRRFRKFGAAVLSISQSPADFADTPHAAGILANTQYRYLLRVQDPDEAARLLGLGDRQRDLLATLSQEKGRYSEVLALVDFTQGREGGVLVVRPSSLDYWIATTDPSEVQTRDAQVHACGDLWAAVQRLAAESPKGLEAGGRTVYDR